MNIQDTIERAFKAAGLNTDSGPMRDVTETIRQALATAGLSDTQAPATAAEDAIDVVAREVPTPNEQAARAGGANETSGDGTTSEKTTADATPASANAAGTGRAGQFVRRTHQGAAGSRDYKLYIPARTAGQTGQAMPLVLMLHGCTQNADDFAAGTRMNRLADQHGFLVVYPEQSSTANPSKCWNWFRAQDQVRGGGEPELIAGIVKAVTAGQLVDTQRIFVAGLSAGAAMAVILGETYPDLFAAVGAHSGLAYAAAHDIPSAMAAMKGRSVMGSAHLPGTANDPRRPTLQAVPLIVFHGDRDHTVQHSNGEHIAGQATHAHTLTAGKAGLTTTTEAGKAGGRSYTRTRQTDDQGRTRVEVWTLHGAGHAWSGGDPAGTYTDRSGPDASAEMLRFFLAQTGATKR